MHRFAFPVAICDDKMSALQSRVLLSAPIVPYPGAAVAKLSCHWCIPWLEVGHGSLANVRNPLISMNPSDDIANLQQHDRSSKLPAIALKAREQETSKWNLDCALVGQIGRQAPRVEGKSNLPLLL